MFAGSFNFYRILEKLPLTEFEGFFFDNLAITDNGVERRAQFVSHRCQKRTLGFVGGNSRFFCLSEFFRSLVFGNILQGSGG